MNFLSKQIRFTFNGRPIWSMTAMSLAQAPCRGLLPSLLAGGGWCGTANGLHRRRCRPPQRLTDGNELPGTGITSNFLRYGLTHVVLSFLSPAGKSTIQTALKRVCGKIQSLGPCNLSRFRSLPGPATGRRGHRGGNLGALRFLADQAPP